MIATLIHNTITPIVIGSNLFDSGIFINYVCRRGGTLQAGRITVSNASDNPDPIHESFFGSCGITAIEVENTIGTDIELLITVDDASSNDVEFNYSINKIGTTIPIPACLSVNVPSAALDTIVLTFDLALDETAPSGGFTVTGKTIVSEVISGNTITLTVSEAYESGDTVLVQYLAPELNNLKGLAGGVVAGFSDEYTLTLHPELGLHAASIEWIDDTHIRVTYDWTDADQLLDWEGLGGSTISIIDGRCHVSVNLVPDISTMRWVQPMACSSIIARQASTTVNHLNFYTNLSNTWAGVPYNANPSIGIILAGGTPRANINGGFVAFGSIPAPGATPYDYTFSINADSISIVSTANDLLQTHPCTPGPVTTGRIALGAFQSGSGWGTVIIEGEITLPE